jgi:hypothetical protein
MASRCELTRWRVGDGVDAWSGGSFFARDSFALQLRQLRVPNDMCSQVGGIGFVGDGVVLNVAAEVFVMATAPAARSGGWALAWWHAKSDANEIYDEARLVTAGPFVLFGSDRRQPCAPDASRSVVLRAHMADLVGFRHRAYEICVALQMLRLPAWVTLVVLQVACAGAPYLTSHFIWQLVIGVKHFRCAADRKAE